MAIAGISNRVIPALALAAAVAACQPGSPTAQQAGSAAGTDTPGIFNGLGPGERLNFQCSELALGVAPDDEGNAVRLSYSGQRLVLPRTGAATGTRYADGQGNELLVRDGDSAVLMLAGEQRRDCVRADRPSPWDRAADNGVTYRAVGQEPGWLVEVTEGAGDGGAALTAHLDYGQQLVEALDMQRDGDTFSGTTATGQRLELSIQERECADSMSGERFRTAATLVVDGEQYEGCGAWLSAD